MGTGIGIAASFQLAATSPTHAPVSLAPAEPVFEFDRAEHPIRRAILTEQIVHRDGFIAIPQGPGIGIDRSAPQSFKMG